MCDERVAVAAEELRRVLVLAGQRLLLLDDWPDYSLAELAERIATIRAVHAEERANIAAWTALVRAIDPDAAAPLCASPLADRGSDPPVAPAP